MTYPTKETTAEKLEDEFKKIPTVEESGHCDDDEQARFIDRCFELCASVKKSDGFATNRIIYFRFRDRSRLAVMNPFQVLGPCRVYVIK